MWVRVPSPAPGGSELVGYQCLQLLRQLCYPISNNLSALCSCSLMAKQRTFNPLMMVRFHSGVPIKIKVKDMWNRFLKWYWTGNHVLVILGINVLLGAALGIHLINSGTYWLQAAIIAGLATTVLNFAVMVFNTSGPYRN